MPATEWVRTFFFLALVLLLSWPIGEYMAKVLEGERTFLSPLLFPIEKLVYRLSGVRSDEEMNWKTYAISLMLFNGIGLVALYLLQRAQGLLPGNPAHLGAIRPDTAFNVAVSFVTNTNWQSYSGEAAMSYLTQMLGLTVQNFVSAASGIAVLAALIRGLRVKQSEALGNFWVDLTRSTLYVLLPLSLLLAVVLVSQGVVQTFGGPVHAHMLQGGEQTIAVGPAGSQIAIKQLGTNGGGFFGANSAHPFENPNGFTNLLSVVAILLLPASLCVTFGRMVRQPRQGVVLLAAMTVIFVGALIPTVLAERAGNPAFASLGLASSQNLEGKEARIGVVDSTTWAMATTAASNGSTNASHDSLTPIAGLLAMGLMELGEVVFGGVGSGLYGMLVFAIIAVFVAGLMVGRTPEYLGKKIESFEMKMASLVILIPCGLALLGAALPIAIGAGAASISNPGPHGFSQVLYAYSSMAGNNGSAFGGFAADMPLHNLAGGVVMFVSRFWLMIPVLAIAGSLAKKKLVPVSPGTLPTHTPLFASLLVCVVVIVGALTFVPALALGPIVEQLKMLAH